MDEITDWDLWGPPYYQESGYAQQGWQCDYYFGYGFDTIEENATNEKSCIQVLRILIVNADSEIDELEKDLVSLQSELAWFENEEWPEICCNALTKRMEHLDMSIRKLRDKNKNDLDLHLLMHTQPAESLDEIVKVLLKTYCHTEDEKHTDVTVINSSSNSAGDAADLDKSVKLSSSDSKILVEEKMEGATDTTIEDCSVAKLSQKLPVEITTGSDEAKPAHTDGGEESGTNLLELATGHSDRQNEPSNSVFICNSDDVTKESVFSPVDKNMIQTVSLKSADKIRHSLDIVKYEPQNDRGKDASLNSHKHAIGSPSEKIEAYKSDLSTNENGETESAGKSTTSNSSLNHEVRANFPTENKPKSGNTDKKSSLVANELASGPSNGIKKPCKSDLNVKGNKGVEEHGTETAKCSSLTSVDTEGKDDLPRVVKSPPAAAENDNPRSLRYAADLNRNRKISDGGLNVFQPVKVGNSDMEQRLCEFANNACIKWKTKGSRVGQISKIDSMVSFPEKVKRENPPMGSGEAGPTKQNGLYSDSSSIKGSLMETVQSSFGLLKVKRQPESSISVQPLTEAKECFAASNDSQISTSYLQKKRKNSTLPKVKSEIEFETGSLNQSLEVATENSVPGSNKTKKCPDTEMTISQLQKKRCITLPKFKRQLKSELDSDFHSFSHSSEKTTKNPVQPLNEARGRFTAFSNSKMSTLPLQNRRRDSSPSPSSPIPLAIEYPTAKVNSGELLSVTNPQTIDNPADFFHLTKNCLKKLSVCELKEIGKEIKAPNMCKLRKDELVEKLSALLLKQYLSGVQEPLFSPTEIVLRHVSLSNAKRKSKSETGFDITQLSQTLENKSVRLPCKAKDSTEDCQVSLLHYRKKRKNNLVSPNPPSIKNPTVEPTLSKSNVVFDLPVQALSITESNVNDDSCTMSVIPVTPFPLKNRVGFDNLSTCDLKAVAKKFNLQNMHKLQRHELVELLDKATSSFCSRQEPLIR